MASFSQILQTLNRKTYLNVGKFYGSEEKLALGTGLLYEGVRFPIYNSEEAIFHTVKGKVLIVTHECDISQDNPRPYNNDLLICPIIPLEQFFKDYQAEPNAGDLAAFIDNVAIGSVRRLMYIPPLDGFLESGAILYFNLISSTRVDAFSLRGVECKGALSAYGLQEVDRVIKNLLFREKSDELSFTQH